VENWKILRDFICLSPEELPSIIDSALKKCDLPTVGDGFEEVIASSPMPNICCLDSEEVFKGMFSLLLSDHPFFARSREGTGESEIGEKIYQIAIEEAKTRIKQEPYNFKY
jgi:hypothetical protein